jgi:exodeoxyribonuclease VII small subunit
MAKGPSFEQAMRDLEEVVAKLEGDELTLQQALEYFENGVKLMRVCDTHLKSAEGKLKELLRGEDGEFVEKVLGITLESVVGNEEFED